MPFFYLKSDINEKISDEFFCFLFFLVAHMFLKTNGTVRKNGIFDFLWGSIQRCVLNYCTEWKDTNLLNSDITIDFQNVFSNDIVTLRVILPYIQKVWNVKNANGTMHTE